MSLHSTTILAVRRDNTTVIGGDGQVTLGHSVIKHGAKKIRKLYNDRVLVGFAGSAADGLALMERLEAKLEEFRGNLVRACVELAKEWRMDKYLRRLEAMLLVVDKDNMLLLSGNGDVIEPDEPVIAIGSGGDFARSAALALYRHTNMSAEEIVKEALKIASEICIYTNSNFVIEKVS
ncbi:20S proteasome A and B subunits [Hydrogenobacter thermophilus TK-6]|uniref:ATP-dependent protease subunit HslV n=1 Tax=Hydrogenobacter thermophilus (strain DSM 6534 / IAM 12695 / TK-6) TaxID=608538 RepID=D3DIT3_HYDTT|nr:ATP-dependent protease subunit HslV [Hydrogenobacter thermophilus]ADO45662.1 20S proteasome A and B subunits [Hydrogenobacter thermophilus TK-6]BAI69735.1 ATP-dependent protease [Hydrogenobacter thermophilus TK-6]